LTQIAFDKSEHSKDIDEVFNVLLNVIHRIQLTKNFPPGLAPAQLENIRCAAVNLHASVIQYLAVTIKILRKSMFGTALLCL